MASTTLPLLHVSNVRIVNKTIMSSSKPSLTANRRQCLLLLTATSASIKALELPAKAEDIGLFGIRKKIKKAEEEVEQVVKEGIENAEKGLENAEKGLENAEKGLENVEKGLEDVEKEVEASFGFSGLVQAGAVVGAEVVGVLVATSVVSGILGPEGQNS